LLRLLFSRTPQPGVSTPTCLGDRSGPTWAVGLAMEGGDTVPTRRTRKVPERWAPGRDKPAHTGDEEGGWNAPPEPLHAMPLLFRKLISGLLCCHCR
jgi:hypothetical protein